MVVVTKKEYGKMPVVLARFTPEVLADMKAKYFPDPELSKQAKDMDVVQAYVNTYRASTSDPIDLIVTEGGV